METTEVEAKAITQKPEPEPEYVPEPIVYRTPVWVRILSAIANKYS